MATKKKAPKKKGTKKKCVNDTVDRAIKIMSSPVVGAAVAFVLREVSKAGAGKRR